MAQNKQKNTNVKKIAVVSVAALVCCLIVSSLMSNSYTNGQLEACRTMYDIFIKPTVGGECRILNGEVCLVGPMGEVACLEKLKELYL